MRAGKKLTTAFKAQRRTGTATSGAVSVAAASQTSTPLAFTTYAAMSRTSAGLGGTTALLAFSLQRAFLSLLL